MTNLWIAFFLLASFCCFSSAAKDYGYCKYRFADITSEYPENEVRQQNILKPIGRAHYEISNQSALIEFLANLNHPYIHIIVYSGNVTVWTKQCSEKRFIYTAQMSNKTVVDLDCVELLENSICTPRYLEDRRPFLLINGSARFNVYQTNFFPSLFYTPELLRTLQMLSVTMLIWSQYFLLPSYEAMIRRLFR